MPVNEFLDGDGWIMRSLPDEFFIPERSGGIHLTDEDVVRRLEEIPEEHRKTAVFLINVLQKAHKIGKTETYPCLVARVLIYMCNLAVIDKTGEGYDIPCGWYTDAIMIDPEWIVRITNGLVRWEGDESCKGCGRTDCRFYICGKMVEVR